MNDFYEDDYVAKLDKNIWLKILKRLKPHKKYAFLVIITNLFIAIIDTTFPLLNMYAINNFVEKKNISTMPFYIIGYITLFVTQAFFIYNFIKFAGHIESSVVYDIRKEGFKKLQELSFSYYDKTPVGWIISRLSTDAQRIGDVLAWGVLDIGWSLLVIILVVVNMLILNSKLALNVMIVFPIIIVITYFFQKNILKGHRKVRSINSKITGVINESIMGAKTTKTLVREERNFDEFQVLSNKMRTRAIRVATLSAIYMPLGSFIGSIGLAIVMKKGGSEVINGTISIAVFSVFINYIFQMFEPIQGIARILSEMQSAQASAERTFSLLETESEIVDDKEFIKKYGDYSKPKTDNWEKINGEIEFKNITFAYNPNEKILENFNLKVRSGEKIALVGETGSGKSTIVNLLCRFYEPTSGEILIDGVDYRERTQIWLHSNLGYVLQSPHLFSGSIKENIRYGKLDATDEEIIEASKKVNAYDFINKLENGFDYNVGEGGNRLSSGEKQLISFARAIISKPRLFILDEATSSIDTETEQVIQKAIEQVLQGRTSFIIAHRLSTIRFCDRILVIQNGEIIESGNHKELLKNKGHYYDLYTNQFKSEVEQKIFSEINLI